MHLLYAKRNYYNNKNQYAPLALPSSEAHLFATRRSSHSFNFAVEFVYSWIQ